MAFPIRPANGGEGRSEDRRDESPKGRPEAFLGYRNEHFSDLLEPALDEAR